MTDPTHSKHPFIESKQKMEIKQENKEEKMEIKDEIKKEKVKITYQIKKNFNNMINNGILYRNNFNFFFSK